MPLPSIYLDNSTTSQPSQQAVSRMMPFLTDLWGIPSSPHQKGQELYSALTESFKMLYQLIGAQENSHFVLTSSGAEAVNHVISSVYRDVTLSTGKNQFLAVTTSEAPAIMAIEKLESLGCSGKMIDVNAQGIVTEEKLIDALSARTALVSIPWADGMTGVIQPLSDMIKLCKQRGVLVHLEATHVLGKLFYDLEEIDADFITFNGDQLHAPKGSGGLYIKQGVRCSSFIAGGSEQAGLRAGAVNMPALVALSTAAKETMENQDYMCTEIARLRDKLERGVLQNVPYAVPLFHNQERLPHCTAIAFPGIANEAFLFHLNRKGIYANIGGGSFQQISLILEAAGISSSLAHGAVSFSLSRYTTESEIDAAIVGITETAKLLSNVSKKIIEHSINGL